jgi:hypothetical protein
MTRLYGRAPCGHRVVDAVPAQRGHWKTSTFIGALRCDGLTAPDVFSGPINDELLLAYRRAHQRRRPMLLTIANTSPERNGHIRLRRGGMCWLAAFLFRCRAVRCHAHSM